MATLPQNNQSAHLLRALDHLEEARRVIDSILQGHQAGDPIDLTFLVADHAYEACAAFRAAERRAA